MLRADLQPRWPVLKPAGLFQSRLARFKAGQQFNCAAIYALVYLRNTRRSSVWRHALSHVVDAAACVSTVRSLHAP